jgi:TolA-binding protein
MKRYGLAKQQFLALVEARPFDREANLCLGLVNALNGRLDDAKRYFLVAYGDTSLTLPEPEMDTPDWVDWPHGPERERVRTQRMTARKNSQETFQEGDAAFDRGDLETAERLYKRALELYPRWGRMQYEAHTHLGTVYGMRGETRKAAYEFLLGINSYRNYPLCYFLENAVGYGPARHSVAARPSGHTGLQDR